MCTSANNCPDNTRPHLKLYEKVTSYSHEWVTCTWQQRILAVIVAQHIRSSIQYMRRVTRMSESCLPAFIWMSHVTHVGESYLPAFIIALIVAQHIWNCMNESCHTCGCVMCTCVHNCLDSSSTLEGHESKYRVATISRLLKIVSLFCRISSLL